jgi:hypothetical protein
MSAKRLLAGEQFSVLKAEKPHFSFKTRAKNAQRTPKIEKETKKSKKLLTNQKYYDTIFKRDNPAR